ncbi:hypothetical protein EV126DRAFT_406472 [Verticillium dahliae]|nr:hypothetical protein EV126DRAFT_406472 [Verticillium dahliae]
MISRWLNPGYHMSSARAAQLVHASCCGFAGPWPRQKAHDEAAVEALRPSLKEGQETSWSNMGF